MTKESIVNLVDQNILTAIHLTDLDILQTQIQTIRVNGYKSIPKVGNVLCHEIIRDDFIATLTLQNCLVILSARNISLFLQIFFKRQMLNPRLK